MAHHLGNGNHYVLTLGIRTKVRADFDIALVKSGRSSCISAFNLRECLFFPYLGRVTPPLNNAFFTPSDNLAFKKAYFYSFLKQNSRWKDYSKGFFSL